MNDKGESDERETTLIKEHDSRNSQYSENGVEQSIYEDFDKHELIVWASKLELESIDYRNTSIDLIHRLGLLSQKLTENLDFITKSLCKLRSEKTQRKDMQQIIDTSIAEELDKFNDQTANSKKQLANIKGSVEKLENYCKTFDSTIFSLKHKISSMEDKLTDLIRTQNISQDNEHNTEEKMDSVCKKFQYLWDLCSKQFDGIPDQPKNLEQCSDTKKIQKISLQRKAKTMLSPSLKKGPKNGKRMSLNKEKNKMGRIAKSQNRSVIKSSDKHKRATLKSKELKRILLSESDSSQ